MGTGRPAWRLGRSGAALRSLLPGSSETVVRATAMELASVHTLLEKRTKAAPGEGPAAAPRVRVSRTLLAACGPVPLVAEDTVREGLSGAASAPLRRPPRPSETETHRLTQLS